MELRALVLLMSVLLFCAYDVSGYCYSSHECVAGNYTQNRTCCGGDCVNGSHCFSCTSNSDCTLGNSCCESNCKPGESSCIGYYCNSRSDCQSDEVRFCDQKGSRVLGTCQAAFTLESQETNLYRWPYLVWRL